MNSTNDVNATQETVCSNCSVTQRPEFTSHTSSSVNHELDVGPAANFSTTQEREFMPAQNISSKGIFSPSANYSATEEPQVGPWLEAKSTIQNSRSAILEMLRSSQSQISSVSATKKIVLSQIEEEPSLKNTMSSFIFQNTEIPEQRYNNVAWFARDKAETSHSEDKEDGYLNMLYANLRGKRSFPASRETTTSFLSESKNKKKSLIKILYEVLFPDRPLSGAIKRESLCGFEFGMCRWKQSTNDDLNWRLAWGSVNDYDGHAVAGMFLTI